LAELWRHSTYVAAFCFVLAKNHTKRNADEAFLCGLLHGVGRLYILARADRNAALFADREALEQVMRDWHASIGKTILENWEMGEEIVQAVANQEDIDSPQAGPPDLTDVLICANMMAAYFDQPADLELNMQGVMAFRRLGLDGPTSARVLQESRDEIDALRLALGG
jgi:HD-like signal output (HDOD) protein